MPSPVSITIPFILVKKIQHSYAPNILVIVQRKSKKPLMLMPIVEPMTKTMKQQTNGLSSILSRYFNITSFNEITPFMCYYSLGQEKSQEKKESVIKTNSKDRLLTATTAFLIEYHSNHLTQYNNINNVLCQCSHFIAGQRPCKKCSTKS